MQAAAGVEAVRTCSHCGETKPLSAFSKSKKCALGAEYRCRPCKQRYVVAARKKVEEKWAQPFAPDLTPMQRECLRCDAPFTAKGKFNRICPGCTSTIRNSCWDDAIEGAW